MLKTCFVKTVPYDNCKRQSCKTLHSSYIDTIVVVQENRALSLYPIYPTIVFATNSSCSCTHTFYPLACNLPNANCRFTILSLFSPVVALYASFVHVIPLSLFALLYATCSIYHPRRQWPTSHFNLFPTIYPSMVLQL